MDFKLHDEPSLIPTLIGLEGFPIHIFSKSSFLSTNSPVGKPLKLDDPTANLHRPSIAHIYLRLIL